MPELVKVAEEGPGWEPEISGRENQGGASRGPGGLGRCWSPSGYLSPWPWFSRILPRQRGTWISISLFIRGVNNPCIVFLLLDYFVFVLKKSFVKI